MKKIALSLALLIIATLAARAQVNDRTFGQWDSDSRHAVSFSMGSYPSLNRMFEPYSYYYYDIAPQEPSFSENYKLRSTSSPTFNLGYSYRQSKTFEAEVAVTYATYGAKYHNLYSDSYAFTERSNVFAITAAARLHWLNSRHCNLYTLFALGAAYSHIRNANGVEGASRNSDTPIVQFSPIGFRYTWNRVFTYFELGGGSIGTTRVGVGYKL